MDVEPCLPIPGRAGGWEERHVRHFTQRSSTDLIATGWKNSVLRRGHRRIPFLILPENPVQACSSGRIGTGEIHLRRFARTSGVALVCLVDQAVLQIAIIRLEGWLIACAGKHRSHRWS